MKKSLLKLALGIVSMTFGVSSFAQVYTFTNCASTGRVGPTQVQINAAYTGANTLTGAVTITTQGIQEWTVPTTGTYSIQAIGGQGGKTILTDDSLRGAGADMQGDFNLTAGQVIKVVVGQEGIENPAGNVNNGGGHGGGGSFVWINTQTTPLIVAGGGGGGSIINTVGPPNSVSFCRGKGAPITNDGLPSHSGVANFGTAGGDGTVSPQPAKGWITMFGASDFIGDNHGGYQGEGGFGGGGGEINASGHVGGGGGGYSGGGSGEMWINSGSGNTDGRNGGGGGGSFNSGTNQVNFPDTNSGMGSVIITYLCSGEPAAAIAVFANDSVCLADPAITLPSGTPVGGTYSGPGVSGSTFNPTTAGIGTHYVVYTNTDSCSITTMDSTVIEVESCVGINENGSLAGVSIYPNPTNGLVNISLGSHNGSVNYTISTVEGRIVTQEQNVTTNKMTINLNNESKGIYLLKIEDTTSSKVYKIIKE